MNGLLLDAGVWLAARDADDRFHPESRELVSRGSALAALDLTLYEVANVAAVRWGSTNEADRLVALVLTACADRLVRVDRDLMRAAAATAVRHSITVYDAAYVVCARERTDQLVSTDLRDLVNRGLAISPSEAQA